MSIATLANSRDMTEKISSEEDNIARMIHINIRKNKTSKNENKGGYETTISQNY